MMPESGVGLVEDHFESSPDPGMGACRNRIPERWHAVPIAELSAASAEVDWIWQGIAARRSVTLFTGLWKCGETTLLSHLLRALSPGQPHPEFVGQPVAPCKVLVVTEEDHGLWAKRRDELGLQDVGVIARPFLGKPRPREWERFIQSVADQARREGVGLVVFDSLPNLWSVKDENDASQVTEALAPLNHITEAGAGVMLVAHPKKGDAGHWKVTRGSGALPAAVDILAELRPYEPERRSDTRRVISAVGRHDVPLEDVVVDFDREAGYELVGKKREASAIERTEALADLILDASDGKTVSEILAAWRSDLLGPAPGHRTLKQDLDDEAHQHIVQRVGGGVKGQPHRYTRRRLSGPNAIPASSHTTGANIDSNSSDSANDGEERCESEKQREEQRGGL